MAPRIKVVSDGTAFGTEVLVDGEPLEVTDAVWSINAAGSPELRLTVVDVAVDLSADSAEVIPETPELADGAVGRAQALATAREGAAP